MSVEKLEKTHWSTKLLNRTAKKPASGNEALTYREHIVSGPQKNPKPAK
jgi:hypothetical protein